MPTAPPVVYAVPTATPGNVGAVFGVTLAPGNVGPVFAPSISVAAPPAPPSAPSPTPGNVGSVFAPSTSATAPPAPPAAPTKTPGDAGSVMLPALDKAASLTNQNIVWTAARAGLDGNNLSLTIAAAAVQASTGVSVANGAITVYPGTLAQMHINGAALHDKDGGPLSDVVLLYAGMHNGYPHWTDTGESLDDVIPYFGWSLAWVSGSWYVTLNGSDTLYQSHCVSVATSPVGLTYDLIGRGTGTAVVYAIASSKDQVIDAVCASPASLVIHASPSGDTSGSISALAQTNLSGGTGSAVPSWPMVGFSGQTKSPGNVGSVFAASSSAAAPPQAFTPPALTPATPPVITP